jgi:hypothetical protein
MHSLFSFFNVFVENVLNVFVNINGWILYDLNGTDGYF